MSDARASDTNRLVSQVITYIPFNSTAPSAPLQLLNDKSKRGWNHDTTAAALCPLKLRATFLLDTMYGLIHKLLTFDPLHDMLQSIS